MDAEKKTIGRFISVLRRASGMTQQELGDRLFVSDKTVSRWERDESTPDLSLIPVIADLFGVTVDELLRGERRTPTEGGSSSVSTEDKSQQKKSERKFRALLRRQTVWFRNRCLIALGTALLGLVLALICRYIDAEWIRRPEWLAFGVGLVGVGVSVILTLCTANTALSAVETDEDEEEAAYTDRQIEGLKALKMTVIKCTTVLMAVDAVLLFCVLPLDAPHLLRWCILTPLVSVLLFVVYDLAVERLFVKRGWLVYPLEVWSRALTGKRKRLKAICILGSIVAVFFAVIVLLNSLQLTSFMKGTQFTDAQVDELCAYVEEYGGVSETVEHMERSEKIYDDQGKSRTVRYDPLRIYDICAEERDGQTVYTVYLAEEYDSVCLIFGIVNIAAHTLCVVAMVICVVAYVVLLVKYRKKRRK